jgi:hypothetical protein
MNAFLTFALGLFLRILLPVGLTLLVFAFLRRLDERWQKGAMKLPVVSDGQKPCWQVRNCPPEQRQKCPAAAQPTLPCWQVFRAKDGVLKDNCLACDVFRQAPVPVQA